MPRSPHSRKDPAGKRRSPDGSGGAMEHGAVCCRASAEMMALDQARESPPFAGSDHIHVVAHLENLVDEYLVPWFDSVTAVFEAKLPENTDRRDSRLLEAPGQGLVDAIGPNKLHKSELDRIVTVFLLDLLLDHDTRTGLDHGDGSDRSILFKYLSHSHLNSNQSVDHGRLDCGFPISDCGLRINLSNPQSAIRNLLVFCAEGFDLHVNRGRKIELHQGIDCLRRWLQNIHQPLVRANFKLFTGFLVHVRRTQHAELVLHSRERYRPQHSRTGSLGDVNDLRGGLVEHTVIVSLQPDSYFFVKHNLLSRIPLSTGTEEFKNSRIKSNQSFRRSFLGFLNSFYSKISMIVLAPTVFPPSRMANPSPFSLAIGVISLIVRFTLSPGITISVPAGTSATPVTSVVRK